MDKPGNIAPPPYTPGPEFQPNYAANQPPPPQVINTVVLREFGPEPMDIQCPHCQAHIKTQLDFKIGAFTWLLCILLGLLVCLCDCTKVDLYRG